MTVYVDILKYFLFLCCNWIRFCFIYEATRDYTLQLDRFYVHMRH